MVRIESASGLYGLGSASPGEHVTGESPDACEAALVSDAADIAGAGYGLLGAPLTQFIDEEKIDVAVRATREAGVWNVPTLSMAEKKPEKYKILVIIQ